MPRSVAVALALLALAAGFRTGAYTDPGLAGPFAVAREPVDVPTADLGTIPAEVFYPLGPGGGIDPGAGLCPVVVFQHGFSRSPGRYTDIGERLASRGYVVLLGDFPCGFLGCDHSANANRVSRLIDWILERDLDAASIFFGRIDRESIGTAGHSAGGLHALVAAARDPRVRASAPLDGVDNGGLGVGAAATTTTPIAHIYSEPSSCNADQSAADLYAAANPQKRGTLIVGANHCDPERNGDFFGCELTCGRWNASRHANYVRQLTAWFEYFLRCDEAYYDDNFGTWPQARVAEGTVAYQSAMNPPAPVDLATAWNGRVEVSRAAPLRCVGVTGWNVYRSTTAGGPYDLAGENLPIGALTWIDPQAAPGTTYFYVARDAFRDFAGEALSAPSNETSLTTPPAGENVPKEAAALFASRGPAESIAITYQPAPCASDHIAYWDVVSTPGVPLAWEGQACALGAGGEANFDPGPVLPGSALRFVVAGSDGAIEGSYGRDSSGNERPEAAGLPSCDPLQQLDGACAPAR